MISKYYGLNRYLCDVLEDMRNIVKTGRMLDRTKNMLNSLIEEAQVMGNRMEAGLQDSGDLMSLHDEIKKKKQELKELEEAVIELDKTKP